MVMGSGTVNTIYLNNLRVNLEELVNFVDYENWLDIRNFFTVLEATINNFRY